MKTAILITLIGISAGTLYAQDSTIVFDLVYQGDFPVSLWGKQIKPAHLVIDQPDYLVTLDSADFHAFHFDSTNWREVASTPFKQDSINRINNQHTWTIGDLDNDGADEIVTWSGKKICQFNLKGQSLIRKESDFPFYIQQGVIGDVFNNRLNALVLFGFDEGCYAYWDNGRAISHAQNLCIVRPDSGRMKILWADGCQIGYFDYSEVPPDRLDFIAHFTSLDKNQLVITMSQSDMSPSFYHVLTWDGYHLRKTEEFHLINGKKVGELPGYARKPDTRGDMSQAPVPEYPFSCGGINPITFDGKPALVDNEYDTSGVVRLCLQPEGDHFKILPVIFNDSHRNAGGSLWMDIDGQGKGILGSSYQPYKSGDRPENLNWHYSFYRIRE